MRKPTLILALLALTLTGCGEDSSKYDEKVIFANYEWDILKLNDSTLLMVPHSRGVTPMIRCITHDPDCTCHQKGEEK